MCIVFLSEEENAITKKSRRHLENFIRAQEMEPVTNSCSVVEEEEEVAQRRVVADSPFTAEFKQKKEQAMVVILAGKKTGKANGYFCPGVVDLLLRRYMGLIPLWSGILLGDLKRYSGSNASGRYTVHEKTRDTNCHVELWFGLVKNKILFKKAHLRPAEFIQSMFTSLQGRYVEHINEHSLPIQILYKSNPEVRPKDDHQEAWKKRDKSTTRKSKYFNPPESLPTPKGCAKKTKKEPQSDIEKRVTSLWRRQDTEVVVIEAWIHLNANKTELMNKIFLMDHYRAGVILFEEQSKVERHLLSAVNLGRYEAVLSAVLVNNNHWNLLFIHVRQEKVFLIDPFRNTKELESSEKAAKKLKMYLNLRYLKNKRNEWRTINWEGGVLQHPHQMDGCSCGVIVAKMAKEIIDCFPNTPEFNFPTNKAMMARERTTMAVELLQRSVFDTNTHCVMCARKKAPKCPGRCPAGWIQCDDCDCWFHGECVGMCRTDIIRAKDVPWKCVVCD